MSSWPIPVADGSEMLLPIAMFCEPVVRFAMVGEEVAA